MLGTGLKETNAEEIRSVFCEDAYIRKPVLCDDLAVRFILHEKGNILPQSFQCDLINVIRMPMRQNHGIHPDDARQERIYAEITGYEMAKQLGVSPSLVCDWEQERKPWPVDMYERYMAVVSEKEARNG